jgi:hypothetical protein
MNGSYTFDGLQNGRHVKASYDLETWPQTQYDEGGEELTPHEIIIDGISMNDNSEFWESFGTDEDPHKLYEFLCIHAAEVDAASYQEYEDCDYEISDEERQVMADIRTERESA